MTTISTAQTYITMTEQQASDIKLQLLELSKNQNILSAKEADEVKKFASLFDTENPAERASIEQELEFTQAGFDTMMRILEKETKELESRLKNMGNSEAAQKEKGFLESLMEMFKSLAS